MNFDSEEEDEMINSLMLASILVLTALCFIYAFAISQLRQRVERIEGILRQRRTDLVDELYI